MAEMLRKCSEMASTVGSFFVLFCTESETVVPDLVMCGVEWGTWKLCLYLFPDEKFLVLVAKNLPKPGFNVLSFPLA